MHRSANGAVRVAAILALAALVASAGACGGSDSTGPSMLVVAGSYDADTFTTTEGGITTDQLSEGASAHLVLAEDGTADGRLVVPLEGIDDSLTGRWTLEGSTVQLETPADVLLRSIPLQVRTNALVGDATFAGTSVHLVLGKE
ncbi:MAG TPA: hypothetical protein VFS44_01730 [Gemmatimonadaceae bacterium]|nr:hypothetical protein [Gemmatimonadaceae bacterium]